MNPTLHFIKINSGWIIDLYLKANTIKILGENIEEYLSDLGDRQTISQNEHKNVKTKRKKNKLNHIKNLKVIKKIFLVHISDKYMYLEYTTQNKIELLNQQFL